jgi:hypothetical protein
LRLYHVANNPFSNDIYHKEVLIAIQVTDKEDKKLSSDLAMMPKTVRS